MGTDFTARLRQALALRHTVEGRAFVGAVLVAIAPRDPDATAARLGALLASPDLAPSLDGWLVAVAEAVGADPERLLSHRAPIALALDRLSSRPAHAGAAARFRARDALRTAVEAT